MTITPTQSNTSFTTPKKALQCMVLTTALASPMAGTAQNNRTETANNIIYKTFNMLDNAPKDMYISQKEINELGIDNFQMSLYDKTNDQLLNIDEFKSIFQETQNIQSNSQSISSYQGQRANKTSQNTIKDVRNEARKIANDINHYAKETKSTIVPGIYWGVNVKMEYEPEKLLDAILKIDENNIEYVIKMLDIKPKYWKQSRYSLVQRLIDLTTTIEEFNSISPEVKKHMRKVILALAEKNNKLLEVKRIFESPGNNFNYPYLTALGYDTSRFGYGCHH